MLMHVGKIQPDVSVFPSKTESDSCDYEPCLCMIGHVIDINRV